MTALSRSHALARIGGSMLVAAAAPLGAQTLTPVRIGALPIDACGEAYYGLERGFFADHGIDTKITTLGNGATIVNGVIPGDLDVGMTNTLGLAVAIAHGVPLQMIAPASLYSPRDAQQGFAVAKDSPITSAKDFIGKTIAVSALSDLNQLGLEAWLERNGVQPSSVQFVELHFPQMGPALARGTVAGAEIPEPSMTHAIDAGEVRRFADVYSAIAPEFATIIFFANKKWIQSNPQLVKNMRAAIFETARWANDPANQPASAEILSKVSKVSTATINAGRRLYYGTSNDARYVTGVLNYAARYGFLGHSITASEFMAS